ncbi:hypothetical protein DPMN_193188 [Dreissena polymorpha]|uniref:Uncharacterized protein n=1 Tax=Dreissena polymorpha TaxID=45954 RepID=A0A9D4BDK2_DREPO|nr:hypothetical protein DPMN_193188 [Dreissena polymorpha]
MAVALGIHPRHASRSTRTINEWLERLERLLRSERVVADGEIGVDHSEPPQNWHLQMDLLRLTIPLVKGNHVLVLHCRGMKDDCGTEAFMLLLNLLKRLPVTQKIHLHCFTGNAYVLSRWLERFPDTWFGFTNKVATFDNLQQEALTSVPESRLLLESYAPYFPLRGNKWSAPNQIYEAAARVAECRQVPVHPSCRRRRIMPNAYAGWESRYLLGLIGTSKLLTKR